MNQFLQDVTAGLSAKQKYLQSKYFYDEKGDKLFQKLMVCEEYYPTRCELEIFTKQTEELVAAITDHNKAVDIIELGAGDATKSIFILKCLAEKKIDNMYYPIDISTNVIQLLYKKLPEKIPEIEIQALNGEYFQMLEKAKQLSSNKKVVLFLGSNIGNVSLDNAVAFCKTLRQHLNFGDKALIGFDLQKDPQVVLNAYNDKGNLTRDFNLNLLHRINKELNGNFEIDQFYHFPTYDPGTGACRSYLVSRAKQTVTISEQDFSFEEGEPIFMEISQKFTVQQTDDLAVKCGFKPTHHFFDSRHWFLDAVWEAI